jgi:hypothetical protein
VKVRKGRGTEETSQFFFHLFSVSQPAPSVYECGSASAGRVSVVDYYFFRLHQDLAIAIRIFLSVGVYFICITNSENISGGLKWLTR